MSLFIREDYQRTIDPFNDAKRQYAIYLSRQTGDPIETTVNYVNEHYDFSKYKDKKDPELIINVRTKNGDKKAHRTRLSNYVHQILKNGLILAPSGTTYLPPTVERSQIAACMLDNTVKRSKYKKAGFIAEQKGDLVKAASDDVNQALVKGVNNSFSGLMGVETGPLANPSGHSALTSTTRTVTSYGNAHNEKFIAGNRGYFEEAAVVANLLSIIQSLDDPMGESTLAVGMKEVMDKYQFHYPTPEDVVNVIHHSTKRYWVGGQLSQSTVDLIYRISPIERAAFCYIGDFYHLRQYNSRWTKDFITRMIQKEQILKPTDRDIRSYNEELQNHVNMIFFDQMKGLGKNYAEITDKVLVNKILATCESMECLLLDHHDLFTVFFKTRNVPGEVARVTEMIRDAVVLSDTDSSGVSIDEWVIWYRRELAMDEISISLASAIIYLTSQILVHNLALLSANIGVEKKELYRLAMKNEFFWTAFIVALAKHYYALTICKEANIYKTPKLEVKGVHLKNSALPGDIIAESDKVKIEILTTVSAGKPIDVHHYLTLTANLERAIIESIRNNKVQFLKPLNIKSAKAYGEPPEVSNYRHHLWWEEVMSLTYGVSPPPRYQTIKTPVTLGSRKKVKDWIDRLEDNNLKQRWKTYVEKHGRDSINNLYIRTDYLLNHGFPKELFDIIDYRVVILEVCNIFYIILSTIGYNKPKDLLLSELGY